MQDLLKEAEGTGAFRQLVQTRSGLPVFSKTNSYWSSGKDGGYFILPVVAVDFLDPLLLLKMTGLLVTRGQTGREAKLTCFEVSRISSCDPVNSSQWVLGQGANLSEPQFSYGVLRGLNEIRRIKEVDLIVFKPSWVLTMSLSLDWVSTHWPKCFF